MMQKATGKRTAYRSRWASFWLIMAALWLQAVVIVCIVLEINRTQIPMAEWPAKMFRLLGLQ